MDRKRIAWIGIPAGLCAGLVGCGTVSSTTPAVPTKTSIVASQSTMPPTYSTNPAIANRYRATPSRRIIHLHLDPMPPGGGPSTATPCWPALRSETYVGSDLNPDTPAPRCLNLTRNQRISLTNTTDRWGAPGYPITVIVGSYGPVTISPEETVYFADPVSRYFPSGAYGITNGPEIYVRDALHREGCQVHADANC